MTGRWNQEFLTCFNCGRNPVPELPGFPWEERLRKADELRRAARITFVAETIAA